MEIYVHPTCTSCKKAEALLAEAGVPVQRRDYFRDRFDRAELAEVLRRVGKQPSEVLSKRSRAYKELGLADGLPGEDALLDLMVEHPTLLRRPLVIGRGGSVVGFNAGGLQDLITREGG